MAESPRFRWALPSRDADQWYDSFLALINSIDAALWGPAREDRNLLIASQGSVTFVAGTSTVSWSSEIRVLAPTGLWNVLASGSAVLADGESLYVQFTRSPVANATLTARVGAQVPLTAAEDGANSLVLAVRYGNRIYWRTGATTGDGEVVTLLPSVLLSDTNPAALGAANPGASGRSSRGDHVHPMPMAYDVGAPPEITFCLNEDTDQAAPVSYGTREVDEAWFGHPVYTVTLYLYVTAFVTGAGLTGHARLYDLTNGAYVGNEITWAGDLVPTTKADTVTLAAGQNQLVLHVWVTGGAVPADRIYVHHGGLLATFS